MTMADGSCEVCAGPDPIGVASTAMPLSVAYCQECARRFAQPVVVFATWKEMGVDPEHVDDMETFWNGRYVRYREWLDGQ